ncbi:hypothetical protein PIROE2DRAFT_4465, partial [Piromyces sp. E2]
MTEISKIYSDISTLKEINCPYNEQKNIHSIVLHSNNIRVIEPGILQKFCNITSLDLSSNHIEKIQGLEKLYNLQILNLSNNKIKIIDGLSELRTLNKLLLAYNKIKTLEGFIQLHGFNYSLCILDIKGNDIDDINEIKYLAGCSKLKHLIVKSRKKNLYSKFSKINPFCQKLVDSYRKEIKILVPQLESIDEIDFYGNILDVSDIGNSSLNSYRSFLKSINSNEPYKINITEESNNNNKNDDMKILQINNINERIKNVEKTLQTFAENKNNDDENKSKSDLVTQNDLKNIITQAINCFIENKDNNVNTNKKNEDINNDGENIHDKSQIFYDNNINNLKLNEIESQISEIMKLLESNKFNQNNTDDKNIKLNDTCCRKTNDEMISIDEYRNQLEDIKVKIINDLRNNISLLNINDNNNNEDNDVPIKLLKKSRTNEKVMKSDSRKRKSKDSNNYRNMNSHDKNSIDNSIEKKKEYNKNENEVSEISNSSFITSETPRYIHVDPNKELLKSIDDLNGELVKIKKENYELQETIENFKIKNKKKEEYCMELENK